MFSVSVSSDQQDIVEAIVGFTTIPVFVAQPKFEVTAVVGTDPHAHGNDSSRLVTIIQSSHYITHIILYAN